VCEFVSECVYVEGLCDLYVMSWPWFCLLWRFVCLSVNVFILTVFMFVSKCVYVQYLFVCQWICLLCSYL